MLMDNPGGICDLCIAGGIIETDIHREILDGTNIVAILCHQRLYYFLGSRCALSDLDHKVIGRSVYRSRYHAGIGQTVLVNDNGGSAAGDISCCSTVRSSVGIGIRRITASCRFICLYLNRILQYNLQLPLH